MIITTPSWSPKPRLAAKAAGGKPPIRRGVFLMELVVYLAMLSIAMVVLADLFATLMQVMRETTQRDTLIGRVDLAVDTLRRDAWSATGMTLRGTGVEMKEPGGTIVWQMGEDGVLTRSDGGAGPGHSWSWKDMPKVSFAVQGTVLTVRVDAGPGDKHEQVALVSQRMAGGKL